jgi:bifunctional NMN adenylyltransferase/nudix hydrolase
MENKNKKIGVFIGRFQPIHNGHLSVIKTILENVDNLIIVLGSDATAKTVKNPWNSKEREDMIRSCLSKIDNKHVHFIQVKDYLYNDNLWITELQSKISLIDDSEDAEITLYGHDKDKSTFYLSMFPKWNFIETGSKGSIDATKIREFYFHKDKISLKNFLPEPVCKKLFEEMDTEIYNQLYDEFHHIIDYKSKWSASPFPPTFVTVDAVVIKSGHVLVVRRKGELGKGLLALPGGFINKDEFIEDACLRELKEETRINLPKDELKKRIVDKNVFDHPNRSLRGRTITHAYCINLGFGELPRVKGSDDAEKAFWMSLRDVQRNEEMFFEDHYHIITHFCAKY